MAQYQTRPARALDKVDPVWARIRSEAEDVARREPELATFIYENILHHDTLEAAIAHRVSQRLDHADFYRRVFASPDRNRRGDRARSPCQTGFEHGAPANSTRTPRRRFPRCRVQVVSSRRPDTDQT